MAVVLGQSFIHAEPLSVSGLTFIRDASFINPPTSAEWNPEFAEIGSTGTYLITYETAALGRHIWVGHASDGQSVTVTFEVITAAQHDPAAAVGLTSARVAKLDRIGSGTAVAVSPVSADATTLTIDRGDDYTDDSAIAFSEPSTGWPDLSDAQSIALLLLNRVNVSVLTVSGAVTNATPGAQRVAFELADSQTAALNLGARAYRFRVKAVLADGADRTLALGDVEVRA